MHKTQNKGKENNTGALEVKMGVPYHQKEEKQHFRKGRGYIYGYHNDI
jgi:hypothetical protein